MERAGERLKRSRERLKLTYREVEQASQAIAERNRNDEFIIALSRLSDIENKGTLPTIYRLYSLCSIYRLEFAEVLGWYGVPIGQMPSEMLEIEWGETHPLAFPKQPEAQIPEALDAEIPINKTIYLSQLMRRWGKLPLQFFAGVDLKHRRYGLIGLDDWTMYPVLHPGSLVLLDEEKRKIASGGWTNEFDRPIYFLERRDGFECGWCSLSGEQLLVQPHPASQAAARGYRYPGEVDIIGQVAGVAMILQSQKRRHAHSGTAPTASPNP